MSQTNLLQGLPAVLEEALRRSLEPGENVVVELPGAMGEGLAVTDRRIAVVREKSSQDGVDVLSYPLSAVTSTDVGYLPTGGMFKINTRQPIKDEDRTVYFPIERNGDFQAATEVANRMLVEDAEAQEPVQTLAPLVGSSCPSCGATIDDEQSFCASCGTQVRQVCKICGGALSADSKFCPHCGTEAKAASTKCSSCGGRINETVMTYCPQCGTAVSKKCMSCGASIVAGWPRCRYCGREIGSMDGLTARGVRAAVRESEQQSPMGSTAVQTGAVDANPAVEHNARGAKLFEEEKYEEAITEFERAVDAEPENGQYHCNLAVAYDELDQDDEARREYERALELNPNDKTALLYLGYMLNEDDEADRAAEMWKRLITIAPGSPEAEEASQGLRAQGEL
jgi:tetratricopeptide (TPR) repeat protein